MPKFYHCQCAFYHRFSCSSAVLSSFKSFHPNIRGYRCSLMNMVLLCFRHGAMDLDDSQGEHVDSAHAHENDSSGGATGEHQQQPGSNKVELLVEKIAGQVVNRLNQENAKKTTKDIQTLAEAIQCLKKDFKSLKRKNSDNSETPPPKKQNMDQGQNQRPSSPVQGQSMTLSDSEPEVSDQETDQELENFLGLGNDNDNQGQEQDFLGELEGYFVPDDGTGDEVGEQIARITNNALRNATCKKEDNTKEKKDKFKTDQDKLETLQKLHKRPKNIANLETPLIEEFLWQQLRRDVKTVDYHQKTAVSNYNQALVPLIKALDMMQTTKVPTQLSSYIMDAFKILSLNIKLTNQNRLDKVKKELLPKYKSLCQEPSASNLLGDNFQEQAKKLEGTKHSLTTSANRSFLGKRGGDNKGQQSSHRYNRNQGNQYQQGYHQNYKSQFKGQRQQASNSYNKGQTGNYGKKQSKRK